ncbi:MAG: DCC1-like thiol-disulfide oxidoreductase family protein [Verrucomicrobiota bacterium]
MKMLYVLYDEDCHFCRRCRHWMEGQPSFLEIVFIAAGSAEAQCRFPGIEKFGTRNELTVISDGGAVYQGGSAFIMCLYALVDFREWSLRLARPSLLPFARQAFEIISNNRAGFSKWFRASTDEEMSRALEKTPPPLCGNKNVSCLSADRQHSLTGR